jgi:hypothetical protein
MARFEDALSRTMDDIKRPPPLPIGHYVMTISKMPDPPESLNSAKGSFEKLTINAQVVAPTDDVDPDELEEFGSVAGSPLRLDFIFNNDPDERAKFEGTLNRLKEFMEKCGVDVSSGSLGEKLPELVGCQFIGEVKHRPDPNDSNIVYSELGRTTAA